ncbi:MULTISPECIES: FecCD family ABC transporter permease [Psychrobacillus]|uniref:Iron ABC transporter permease n=1 Tax=Psychrobacillus faecigallinarum TaxID=2762235 RepID=A0ABR8RDM4_9BACI|nr:iron ABC transporter permease [Psychrobacillus faecigallinarum]MBD7945886.1 iron ABC transporter permease [Psychrobacillus faecigallinarum]QGM29036.1 iron chelate uptake ABC transporter family permease subunit [Bacillus sp. N3536]
MKNKNTLASIILIVSPLFIALAIVLSILYGAKDISLLTVWQAITQFDENNVDHNIIMTSRLPRVIAALLVGAFLAVAGAVMQGITQNYLASPSIMGVNDGSAFVITIAMVFFPGLPNYQMIILSMIGSAIGAGLVFGFGSLIKGGLSPVRLAIIGTVIGTFLSSLASAIAMYFQVSQSVSVWYNAKLHTVNPDMLLLSIPFGLVGLFLALGVAKSITIASLGDEIAVGLGQRTKWVKIISILAVVCLTGTAVALVGKIGFVGLIIPHITRFLVGVDYRFLIPCSAAIGAVFLALCDVLSRFINFPFETPVGVVTAIIGVPFFLYLIRTRGGAQRA